MNFTYDQIKFDDYRTLGIVTIAEMLLMSFGLNDDMTLQWQRNYDQDPIIPFWLEGE